MDKICSRDAEETNEDHTTPSSIDTDQIKTDVVTHADEENTPADDVLDHKIAEATTNGDTSNTTVLCFFLFFIIIILSIFILGI